MSDRANAGVRVVVPAVEGIVLMRTAAGRWRARWGDRLSEHGVFDTPEDALQAAGLLAPLPPLVPKPKGWHEG